MQLPRVAARGCRQAGSTQSSTAPLRISNRQNPLATLMPETERDGSSHRTSSKFALSHGDHKMAAFRQCQMSAWNTARGLVHDVNLWIKSNAERPQHVRIVTHNTNIALLCLISDTVNCDYALGKDFLYGFQMTGHVPDSGVHRPVDRMSEQLLEAQTKQLQDSAYDNLLALQRSVDQQGPSSDPRGGGSSPKKPTNRLHWAG